MSSSASDLLALHERQFFAEQFEKDLKFFQLFFLLINRSSPIRKADLVWVRDGPAGRAGLRDLVGASHPISRACAELLECDKSADTAFCNLINDWGRRESDSCAVSDRAAEERVRDSGATEIYRCPFGLVEIAVPVVCGGQHIATLFNGQVLKDPPDEAGF